MPILVDDTGGGSGQPDLFAGRTSEELNACESFGHIALGEFR